MEADVTIEFLVKVIFILFKCRMRHDQSQSEKNMY